ncbi:DEAD/DEAH box helicase [Sporomusa sphaeroides]|uniref:DEAD/DEAH box helicase n=1 Tax=Sporomusa sphaeroides TaxID=47679 RepID=UPI002B5D755E|nr:DEAD/DEAH box helicase family protein [Sporomusa sphaeroides]HML33421.1 DEAD/DEAH box helicase family protein [Sporomusa sphaeroides]
MLELKQYQKQTLEKLTAFLGQVRLIGAKSSFEKTQDAQGYSAKYDVIKDLEDVPYVCLRLPTGGGKTLLSSYSISTAATSYLEKEHTVVLWLVPTDIIRKQTLEVLKNPLHPNREALDKRFDGRVKVYDISEFTQLRPQDLVDSTNILVTTFAAFRVNSTEGRKVYAHNEDMEPHFSYIPAVDYLERDENGKIKFSFANLLAYSRPLIVIDEAHNHSSKLSVEVLQRLRPSAIVEFTATPAGNSNVLYKVSASELKAEDMIKLPVRLNEHPSWEDAVTNAIQTRERLEELAQQEPAYIRPIVLFQSESKDKEVTVEVILKHLVEQEEIPSEQIAVATGEQRDLDGINLFDPNCPIRYVITVQALKEGWDCSFAYVFCSLAKVQSSKDAEQLLGRVLRMPYAKRRRHEDLNRAYAHVAVASWHDAVGKIRDNLVSMGFEDVEAEANIDYAPPLFPDMLVQEEPETLVLHVESAPKVETLNLALQGNIDILEKPTGGYKVTIQNAGKTDLQELVEKAAEIFPGTKDQNQLVQKAVTSKVYSRPLTPSERGETLSVPQLCLDFGDGLEVAEKETFLPNSWNLLSFPAVLESFQVNPETHVYEIDLQGTKLSERAIGTQETLNFGSATHWTEVQLIHWLDRKLRQPDVPYETLVEYIRRVIEHLQTQKKAGFPDLVRLRFVLEKLLHEKIAANRKKAYEAGIQHVLIETEQVAIVAPDVAMTFLPGRYPAKSCYKGHIRLDKHFYPIIGDMNGEEAACAQIISSHKKVKTWVRNVERYPQYSFWLPTSTDLFYPDFVAELTDGRIAAIEYKGDHLATGSDTKEKDLMGQLWARRSNGQCLFLMATKKGEAGKSLYQQINELLS